MGLVAIGLVFLTIIFFIIYKQITKNHNYWKNKNVPFEKPKFLLGTYSENALQRKTLGQVTQDICLKFPNEPFVGGFYGTEPVLIVQDPDLIKLITTKEFNSFNSREIMDYTENDSLGRSLVFAHGEKWRFTRKNLTPLFSSAKMRKMFHLIEKCTLKFEELLDDIKYLETVEMRSILSRYTIDCICSCAFGVEPNTMSNETKNNPFRLIGDAFFHMSYIRGIQLFVRVAWPRIFYGLGFKIIPNFLSNFFVNMIQDVFKQRNWKPSQRGDFLDLMLNLRENQKKNASDENPASIDTEAIDSNTETATKSVSKTHFEIDDQFISDQCIAIFAAGYETSANIVSFTLYELAKNKQALAKAIEEVDGYLKKRNNKLDYDCMTQLPYLEACVNEALRLYPAASIITREVVENFTLPSGVRLEKGLRIHLPVFHMHRRPEYFPEPNVYRPERFFEDTIKPYTFMPFGEGPRICIGMRFSKMQVTSGLITVLKKYSVSLAEGMPVKVDFVPLALVTQSTIGIRLKLTEREDWRSRLYAR